MVFNLLNEWEPMGPRGSVREEGMNCAHKVLDKMSVRAFSTGMMEGVSMGQLLRSVMILFSFLFILTVNQ